MKKLFFILFIGALCFWVNAQSWSLTGNANTNPPTNYMGTTDCQSLIFKTGGYERMRLSKERTYVGIGTSDPQSTLHLHRERLDYGCDHVAIGIEVGEGKSNTKLFQLTTSIAPQGFLVYYNNNNITFKHYEQANFSLEGLGGGLTIAPDGNIGVNTSTPSAKLDVNGSFNAQSANITGTLTANTLNVQKASFTGNVNFSGNVGIGISNPGTKLDVKGTIRAEEVKVCLTQGCDFVFEEDYNLMGLEELEKFIKINKHLPEVAPAAIMEAEGINVSEMSAKLLQKIEELTLYIIDLQKQIEELKSNNYGKGNE